jgi:hypothetical protein
MGWKKKHKRAIIFLFLFAYSLVQSSLVSAQDETTVDSQLYEEDYDSGHVVDDNAETEPEIGTTEPIRIQKKDLWSDDERNKAKDGLSYTRDPVEPEKPEDPGDSPHKINFHDDNKTWLELFLETRGAQIIILTIVIAFLIYFLVRFLSDRGSMKDKKILQKEYSLGHLEENLENSDMEHFLALALESGDYRTAIRVFYLTIIKNLHEQKLILWKKEKTNFDYVRELRGSVHYDSFRSATRAFELVWYGNAQIAEKEYLHLEPVFRRFIQNMKNGKK